MGGIAHALGHILKTGFDMTQTGQAYNKSQLENQQAEQKLNEQAQKDVEFNQGIGGKLIHNGLVADDGPPGVDGQPTKIYRPVNPDRYQSKVKVGKDTLAFEIPNDAEQHAYAVGRQAKDLHQALTDPTATGDRTLQATESARNTGMTLDAQNQAKEAADERYRQRIGLPMSPDIAGALGMDPTQGGYTPQAAAPLDTSAPAPSSAQSLPAPARPPAQTAQAAPGVTGKPRVLLPDELDKFLTATSAAANLKSEISQRETTKAVQALSGVNDQQSYDAVRQANPQATATWPQKFDLATKASVLRQNVPVEKQPEYDIQTLTKNAMDSMAHDPAKVDASIDEVVPPTGGTANLNVRTKGLVRSAMARGDLKGAQAIIKDASDQIGKTETAVATAKATEPIKINVAAATDQAKLTASGVTQDDFDRAGQQYALSGVMPPLGMGSSGRMRVMHAAEQFARDSGMTPRDMAQAQAAFKGDSASLEKFQAQRDQIVSFEQTAQKNLDQFLDLAGKIPDTGIPWLNTPIRDLDAKVVGSTNMAAVNAARQVANNEIAKVTSGGGLSGVLSDAARNEVKSYNPNSATFAQTKAVAKVLKTDMANRHASMDATLGEIKGRIANPGAAPAPAAATAPAYKVGDTVNYQGKPHKITAIKPDGKLVLEQ